MQIFVNPLNYPAARFMITAGAATAVHWAIMWLLVLEGVHPALATACGALCGALINYLLQYYYAFQSRHPHGITVIRYIAACALGWAANLTLFSLLLWCFNQVLVSQVCTTALVAILNYFVYRRVVFHDRISPSLAD